MAFWLLSVFIQFPIHLFRQIDSHLFILPFERIIDIIMFTFLIIQIIIGFIAIRRVTNAQIARHNSNKTY
jgi:transmembrane protein 17